jgi:hypothetical protein
MVAPTRFGITLPSLGSVPSAFWEMLNWGPVDRILCMGVLCLVTWCTHHVIRLVNKIRMLQRTQMLQRTRRNTIGRRNTRVRTTCRTFPIWLERQSTLLSSVMFSYQCSSVICLFVQCIKIKYINFTVFFIHFWFCSIFIPISSTIYPSITPLHPLPSKTSKSGFFNKKTPNVKPQGISNELTQVTCNTWYETLFLKLLAWWWLHRSRNM